MHFVFFHCLLFLVCFLMVLQESSSKGFRGLGRRGTSRRGTAVPKKKMGSSLSPSTLERRFFFNHGCSDLDVCLKDAKKEEVQNDSMCTPRCQRLDTRSLSQSHCRSYPHSNSKFLNPRPASNAKGKRDSSRRPVLREKVLKKKPQDTRKKPVMDRSRPGSTSRKARTD
ncbi:hypothetical protein HMI54_007647 [Coelomomyces lativittatus]|nr:hypothetical protein HMI54_007647 [Coelomomyces lativittatus]KAJ1508987.1 hypothetical protein HMI56_007022 [Coelomomyces lativittatus]